MGGGWKWGGKKSRRGGDRCLREEIGTECGMGYKEWEQSVEVVGEVEKSEGKIDFKWCASRISPESFLGQ